VGVESIQPGLEWSDYWADFMRGKAAQMGKVVYVGDMRRNPDITAPDHVHLYEQSQRYDFVDISQNNVRGGEVHWKNIQLARERVKASGGRPRPLHNTKIYRADDRALQKSTLRSATMLTDEFDLFTSEPRNDLLSECEPNEAYCAAIPGKQYAVYFPDGGAVKLDVSVAEGPLEVRWLDITAGEWQNEQTVGGGGTIELKAPGPGQWSVLVTAQQ
jgi:hypothetical protein